MATLAIDRAASAGGAAAPPPVPAPPAGHRSFFLSRQRRTDRSVGNDEAFARIGSDDEATNIVPDCGTPRHRKTTAARRIEIEKKDLGPDYYERRPDLRRQIAHHVGKLGDLGFEVTLCRIPDPEPAAPGNTQAA